MLPLPPIPAVLRRAFVGAGLATVVLVGLAATGSAAEVEIVVDGRAHEVRTAGETVADALEDAEITLGVADEIDPHPATPVEDGLRVEIARAITVDVNVHGATARRVTAVVDTVDDVLDAAGMAHLREDGAEVDPAWDESVAHGDAVTVRLPVTVVIEVDGDELETATLASDVRAVLDDTDVELGSDDLVEPDVTSRVVGPMTITIRRVATEHEIEEVVLDHEEVRRETDELERGTTKVEQEGRDGLLLHVYQATLVDGEEVERELVASTVDREPEDRVVLVGTRTPQPEPSRSSGSSGGDDVWDRLARCESGGNWSANSGNGYYGGLQFHPQTWRSVGGSGLPHEHSRDEQIRRAKTLQQRAGWGQWPSCTRRLGLR